MQMLASAASAAHANRLAHDLTDQAHEILAIGQEVSVAAMVGEDIVLGLQGARDGDADEFLANAGMNGPEQLSLLEKLQQALLRFADKQRQANDFPILL